MDFFKIEGNFREFVEELGHFEGDTISITLRFLEIFEYDIGRLKSALEAEFENQLESMRFIHSSDAWRKRKERIISGEEKYEGEQRIKGGGKIPIRFAENWKATGIMEDFLMKQIQDKMQITRYEDGFDAVININLDPFVDSDDPAYAGMPYPLAVEQKLKDRTGGEFGLFEFKEERRRLIFELFVNDFDKLLQRYFPASGKPPG